MIHIGLRYEDLVNEGEGDIIEALELADPEVVMARTRRLKRALDLDVKKKSMVDYAPDVDQETFKFELAELTEAIRARDTEFAILNQHRK